MKLFQSIDEAFNWIIIDFYILMCVKHTCLPSTLIQFRRFGAIDCVWKKILNANICTDGHHWYVYIILSWDIWEYWTSSYNTNERKHLSTSCVLCILLRCSCAMYTVNSMEMYDETEYSASIFFISILFTINILLWR